jgi:uncharacterized repeat protein (TIGR04076 family)
MFKVKCTLVEFVCDEKAFPCHFNYKIGDEIYYDGERFTGRVCPGLVIQMMPVVHGIFLVGHKYTENIMYRYRGHDTRDPSMAKYDGQGFRPLKTTGAEYAVGRHTSTDSKSGKARGGHFLCGDNRTLAHFSCEAVDLSDSDYAQPFYRRAIAILEKIEAEPGIKVDQILDRFTDFEKYEIAPPLTPIFLQVMLEALSDMKYIDIRNGAAFAMGREPPSRPKVG